MGVNKGFMQSPGRTNSMASVSSMPSFNIRSTHIYNLALRISPKVGRKRDSIHNERSRKQQIPKDGRLGVGSAALVEVQIIALIPLLTPRSNLQIMRRALILERIHIDLSLRCSNEYRASGRIVSLPNRVSNHTLRTLDNLLSPLTGHPEK